MVLSVAPNIVEAAPAVPGSLDVMKGALSCQHSSMDAPSLAEMAVRLMCPGGVAGARAVVARVGVRAGESKESCNSRNSSANGMVIVRVNDDGSL